MRSVGDRWSVIRAEWDVERELERVVAGDAPILVGPWVSEVGYEVLYWVPFLRWVAAAYRIPAERLVVMSRGGTAGWYGSLAAQYVEVFDHASPADLAREAAAGRLKQRDVSDLDRRLVAAATSHLGLREVNVLHPSLMFRWFAPFWSGHEGTGFVDRHTRFSRIDAADVSLPLALPSDYVALKLYTARALPDGPVVRAQLQGLVAALAERWPVVLLDTGLLVDDHADYDVAGPGRVVSLSGRLDPRTNLAAQTRIIAGARLFVGTCGSLAWLAPMLGVATIPVFTDDSFLHAHLHVARRVYQRLATPRFSPVDLSGVLDAGLAITTSDRLHAGARLS